MTVRLRVVGLRFGMGPSQTRIGDPVRRDRMLLVSAIAVALLATHGLAGEVIGIDRYFKTNTVKQRTISLLKQDLMQYGALPKMKLDMPALIWMRGWFRRQAAPL